MHHPVTRTSFPVPPVVKRNITLFAASQSFTGAGMQLAGVSSVVTGPLASRAGLPPAGIVAVLLAVIPLLMRAAIRLNDQDSIRPR
jgi:hypothetical protein